MIWLSWRQFRTQALSIAALVLVLIAVLTLTWAQVSELARRAGCQLSDCDARAADAFSSALAGTVPGIFYYVVLVVMLVLPILVGIFWGAPLVSRELETGTYRMIFSQSISRRRWLLAKLAVVGVAVALCEGLVSLVLTPWAELIDLAGGSRIGPLVFTGRGLVPIGYGTLAFAVGVLVGQVSRRTVTAMAVTLATVTIFQVVAPFPMLQYLAQPVVSLKPMNITPDVPLIVEPETNEAHVIPVGVIQGAWIVSKVVVTPAGTEFTGPVDPTTCSREIPLPDACVAWLKTQNLSQKTTYVPASQFWALQWREFGVLMVLTLAVSAFSLRRIQRGPL